MSNIEKMSDDKAMRRLPPAPKLDLNYDSLFAHDLANMLPWAKTADLGEDIRKNGILEPIKLFEGRILDGRHRYKAAKEVGYAFTAKDFETFEGDYSAAEAYVFSTNFLRRQLTNAQKNDVIKTMIEKYPNESNRQIARRCGLNSHSQVANVREKMREPTPEQKKFTDFCKTWDALPEHQRQAFVKEFAPDIRELLAA
jgi:ParB-like nuclease family protein